MNLPRNFGVVRDAPSEASLQPLGVPPLADDYMLVQTVTVAVNPTDWKTLDAPGAPRTLIGCDYAGIVLAVGSAMTRPFKPGDRVCGIAHGGNSLQPWTGAFARFIAVKSGLQMKIPDDVSWEAACTLGVAIATSSWALWEELRIAKPPAESTVPTKFNDWVLIYGGSTATGTIAIQLAKLSGYNIVTTASPKHFDMLRDRGADVVLDYRAETVGIEINRLTKGSLRSVLDCVAFPSSAAICATAFGSSGGIYCSILPETCQRKDVKSSFFLGYSLFGEDYVLGSERYSATPQMYDTSERLIALASDLWDQGQVIAHPQLVRPGGLNGILEGMQEMKAGKISGVKLVYRVDETSWPLMQE